MAPHPAYDALQGANAASAFNQAHGFTLSQLHDGEAELTMQAQARALNHAGTLHAGVVAALLDTAAGYAAATKAGGVVTVGLHISYLSAMNGLARYRCNAEVTRAGKRQVFVDAKLWGASDGADRLIATAAVILAPLS